MLSTPEYINKIKMSSDILRQRFGVTSLLLFGSVAREEQNEDSDVDVCVEMAPKMYLFVELGLYLEDLLGCHVDVVRMHRNMNQYLRKQIEKDGVAVI